MSSSISTQTIINAPFCMETSIKDKGKAQQENIKNKNPFKENRPKKVKGPSIKKMIQKKILEQKKKVPKLLKIISN